MNISKTLELAFDSYQRGDLKQAEYLCKRILKKKQNKIDALHLLGMTYFQRGEHNLAIQYIRRVLQIDPAFSEAYNNLGNIYQSKGQLDEAISCYQKAIELNPNLIGTYMNLGIVLQDTGRLTEAISCYRKVTQLNPYHYGAYNNIGLASYKIGNIDEAIAGYRKALQLNPQYAETFNNLGLALKEEGYIEEAIATYQKALAIKSDYRDAHNNLGGAHHAIGQLSRAISSYQKAIEIDPGYVHAYNNLGSALTDSGDFQEAERYFRRVLKIQSDYSTAYSNILLAMIYNGKNSPAAVFSEHIQFAEQFEKPLMIHRFSHTNDPLSERRLRIGYVSPDFRRHSVAYFIEPVISAHNHNTFEIYCYSDVVIPDAVSKRLQGNADNWLSIVGKSDEDAAALIREHKIDILIDLTGHTAKNRMLLFARKPAPIQISWIGYPATTGLSAMDYRIVDNHTDPQGMTEQFYTEQLLRLPETFLCFLPDTDSPEVSPLPALATGYVTFGSFNNFSKISLSVFRMWQTILKEIPTARLVIKAKSFADIALKNHVMTLFRNEGIADERLELLSWTRSPSEHLELYSRIDIALDTFPYNGTTTTCEALWMGVPVITLAGNTHASRVGVSLLSNVGLPELIAKTPEEYVAKAVELACNPEKLQSLRQRLRDMMLQSPLTDRKLFTLTLENYYRKIWAIWYSES